MDTVNPVLVIVVVVLMEQHAVVQPVPEHNIRLMEQHAVVRPVPEHKHIRQVVLAVLAQVVPTVQHAVVQAVKSKCISFLFLKKNSNPKDKKKK
jgi:hypothetical protein